MQRLLPLLAISTIACQGIEPPPDTLNDAFEDAAHDFHVPRDLLVSTSYALTRLDHRAGTENEYASVGLMNLRLDGNSPTIEEAAAHMNVDVDTLANDPVANLRAGAALMAGWAKRWEQQTGEPVDDLSDWYPVVANWSGADDPEVAEGFAAQVFDHLEWGFTAVTNEGEVVTVAPQALHWRNERAARTGSSLIAQFIPASSSNYTASSRSAVSQVVIHTMEGSYSGAISWFQNSSASASAHYMIRSSDGEITQMVQEEDIAWHAGDWGTNQGSIGIEHEGYVSQPDTWYTDAMYRASAALTRDICDRYGIPIDRAHIIGHDEVPGCPNPGGGGVSCHTDPGSGWDWDYYIELVREAGGGSFSLSSDLPDGAYSGEFEAEITVERYHATGTCEGAANGSASSGHLYLNGTCEIELAGKRGSFPITWTADAMGSDLDGRMVVDAYSADWTGAINPDGSIQAEMSGSRDLGGDIGEVRYAATLRAD